MSIKNVTVFAVGSDYHIMMPTEGGTLMTVKIGDTLYGDESNGVLRSNVKIHRAVVPAAVLDAAGEYTVMEQEVIERRPYFPRLGEIETATFRFTPVPKSGEVRAFHIADCHNRIATPVEAAKKFGRIDFLVLNGDVPEDSSSAENFNTVYEICGRITGGEIPVLFSRGNHDMRGILSECIADFTPNENGNSYYSFRIGNIWGLILDCGEDKDDSHAEYGGTVCCGNFRQRQSDYIRKIIANADSEYNAEGVDYRIVIVHNPFPCIHRMDPPFENECERYAEWTSLIGDNIKPDVMMAGHYHHLEIAKNGDNEKDGYLPFTVVFGSRPTDEAFAGAGFIFSGDEHKIDVQFVDSRDGVVGEGTI